MRNIKIVFKCVVGLFFAALLSFGVFGTYLQHNPEKAGAFAMATMTVDPNASYFEQAMQTANAYTSASTAMAEVSAQLDEMIENQEQAREDMMAGGGSSYESSFEGSSESYEDTSYEGE